jgi:hypothetical protein
VNLAVGDVGEVCEQKRHRFYPTILSLGPASSFAPRS